MRIIRIAAFSSVTPIVGRGVELVWLMQPVDLANVSMLLLLIYLYDLTQFD